MSSDQKIDSTNADSTPDENKDETKNNESSESTMKAICQTGYNDDILKVIKSMNMPIPTPADNEVLIQVYAAAINPSDYRLAKGWLTKMITLEFPHIMGDDCSGVVVSCGKDVKTFSAGMRVAGISPTHHTIAEYVCIPETCVVEVPSNVALLAAASVPCVALTSYGALVVKGQLSKNNKIFIFGGSTACGLYATQIAKAFEASEIVVTSSKEELCKSVGATKVYNYKNQDEDWFKDLKDGNFDIVYDCIGSPENWIKGHKILNKTGRFVSIVMDNVRDDKGEMVTYGKLFKFGLSVCSRKFKSMFGSCDYFLHVLDAGTYVYLKDIMTLMAEKKLRAVLDEESPFTMENVNNAFTKSVEGRSHGKLVVSIVDEKDFKEEEKTEANQDSKDKKVASNIVEEDTDATMKSAAN